MTKGGWVLLVSLLGCCLIIQVNANACNPYPCSVHSTSCLPMGNSYSCNCISPYIGQNCTVTPCSPNPCQHNGTCHIVPPSSFNCSCKHGYYGSTCANVTDFCNPNPCKNGGVCTSTPGVGYTCTGCNTGYGGKNCTTCQQYYRCVNNQSQTVDSNTNCGHICAFDPCLQPQNLWPCDSGNCIAGKIIPFSSPSTFNFSCDCDTGYTGLNCSVCKIGFNFTSDGCNCVIPTPPSPIVIPPNTSNDPVGAWFIVLYIMIGIIAAVLAAVLISILIGTFNQGLLRGATSEISMSSLRSGRYQQVSLIEPDNYD